MASTAFTKSSSLCTTTQESKGINPASSLLLFICFLHIRSNCVAVSAAFLKERKRKKKEDKNNLSLGENIQFRNTDESISSLHIVWFPTSSHFSQRILPSRADNHSPLLRFWVWYLSDVAGAFGVQRHRTRGTTCILCLGNPEHISHYKHWLSTTAIWCFLFSFFPSLISFTLRWKRDGSLEALPTTYLKALMSWHTFSQVRVSSIYLKLQLFSR